jgi:hypothetical protein
MKTYFMFNNFFSENRTVYEIIPKNVVETEGPHMTSQHGAYAKSRCCFGATNMLLEKGP